MALGNAKKQITLMAKWDCVVHAVPISPSASTQTKVDAQQFEQNPTRQMNKSNLSLPFHFYVRGFYAEMYHCSTFLAHVYRT